MCVRGRARYATFAHKYHTLGLLLDSSNLADKGYIGLGLITQARRNKTCMVPADMKIVTRFINSHRAVVERMIAQVKT